MTLILSLMGVAGWVAEDFAAGQLEKCPQVFQVTADCRLRGERNINLPAKEPIGSMESKFNSSRPTDPAHNQSAKRPVAADPAREATSGRNFPPVRPGQVARARALIADTNYPPDELLKRIANLFATHVR